MQHPQHRLDIFDLGTKQIRHRLQLDSEVTGLVEPVDQMQSDQPVRRIAQQHMGLRLEMVGKPRPRGDELIDIGRLPALETAIAVGAAALAQLLRRLVGKDVLDRGVITFGDLVGAFDPVALRHGVFISTEFGGALGRLSGLGIIGAASLFALKQRIAQKLGINEVVELEMAELQQPDRLHKLWCQCQRLGLAEFQPWRKRHASTVSV